MDEDNTLNALTDSSQILLDKQKMPFHLRTPGSRQPSPAEETLPRPPTLLDPTQHSGFPTHPFNHMLNSMDHQGGGPGTQMNSYPPHQMQMGQLQPPVMNGVGGMQMAQSPMMNHQTQGPNQMESPGNLLQQQPPNFDVQETEL
ncbi:unnamed protein product [Ceratitis capitata]|uniref:(Mediterranean fruit fly) hypothetical protein n=1 Tax=Ceratitis capitata TaxID=7213 RepID=A0A811TYY2_CERCA|nr:unnamed protein product [Ceratitis capitata]